MIDQTQRKAYGLIFFTFFIWGSVYVAGKIASTSMPSFLVAALRSVISMVPLWALSRKYLPVRIEREDWKWFLLIGFLGYFFCIHSIQLGIQLTGASMASLVNALKFSFTVEFLFIHCYTCLFGNRLNLLICRI